MRPRLPMSAPRLSSAFAPAAMPITTIRPFVFSALRFAPRFGAPTSSRMTSNGPCSSKPSGSSTSSAPSCATASRASGLRTVAVTCAPSRVGELDGRRADAAGRAVDEQPLAGAQAAPG